MKLLILIALFAIALAAAEQQVKKAKQKGATASFPAYIKKHLYAKY